MESSGYPPLSVGSTLLDSLFNSQGNFQKLFSCEFRESGTCDLCGSGSGGGSRAECDLNQAPDDSSELDHNKYKQ